MNLFSRFLEVRYSPLPTTIKSNSQQKVVLLLPKRYNRLFLLILVVCSLVIFFWFDRRLSNKNHESYDSIGNPIRYPNTPYPEVRLNPPDTSDLPPLYEAYRDYEDRITEWNLKTYGKQSDRYMYLSSHAMEAGWGNILQEMVFTTLLASGSGRG